MSKVKNINDLFYGCSSLKSLPDISKWNTQNIENTEGLFYECNNLMILPDISKWNISNVKKINHLFYGCSTLKSLPDISKLNTKNIINLNLLFYECSSLLFLPDISKWNLNNVTKMVGTFYKCISLKSFPDISNWNIFNINDISFIFYCCSSLKLLPDVSKGIYLFNNKFFFTDKFNYYNILKYMKKKHPFFFKTILSYEEDKMEKIKFKLLNYLLFSDFNDFDDKQISLDFEKIFNYLLELRSTCEWSSKIIEAIDDKLQQSSSVSQDSHLSEAFSNMIFNGKYISSSTNHYISYITEDNNQKNNSQYSSSQNLIDNKDENKSLDNKSYEIWSLKIYLKISHPKY